MALTATIHKKIFHFGFEARTSRGSMKNKTSWFIRIIDSSNPDVNGIGECGPLPGLSPENFTLLEEELQLVAGRITHGLDSLPTHTGKLDDIVAVNKCISSLFSNDFIRDRPAICFAIETALLDLANGGRRVVFENSFSTGTPIPINGLVWMGGLDQMLQQVEIKIRDGFHCVKLKVGGLDFDKERDILQYIRKKYFRDDITIRLDANGAFKPGDALDRIRELSKPGVHSIEQPIKTGSPEMADLIRNSAIPVALDEELIGARDTDSRKTLLDTLRPPFLVLKPTIHGGLRGVQEWIQLAQERNIGWWITSALESSIGLNAIAQYTANFDVKLPQGLGTGGIYIDNIPSPLRAQKGQLVHDQRIPWEPISFD